MGKSVKVVFIKQSPNNDFGNLYIRTIEDRVIRKKSLRVTIAENAFEKYFDPQKQRFREDKRFPGYADLNNIIENGLQELRDFDFSLDLMPDKNKSFMRFWVETFSKIPNHGTRIKHQGVFSKIQKYLDSRGRTDLKFSEITPELLEDLIHYLSTSSDPKKLSQSSVRHYVLMVKSIIEKAKKRDHYFYVKDPFNTITLKASTSDKPVLIEEEVGRLINTGISDPDLNIIRNMFVFQIFGNGLRVSDLLLLRWDNFKDGRLNYRMFKTGYQMSIPLNLNMALVLSELKPESFASYNQIQRETTIDYPVILEDGRVSVEKLNLRSLDKTIDMLRTPPITYNPRVNELLADLRKKNAEAFGEISYVGEEPFFDDETNPFNTSLERALKKKEELKKMIDANFLESVKKLISKVKKQSADHFIFPLLRTSDFSGLKINFDKKDLTESQYKLIKHNTIVYNRKLKEVQKLCQIETNLSSHVSRHTYTNLLLNLDNVNMYDISQSLGHSSLKITEEYIHNGFNLNKLDYLNSQLAAKFKK
jgi:integrase